MRTFSSILLCAFGSAIFIAAYSDEPNPKDAIEGAWTLVKSVNGKEVDQRQGNLSRMPAEVGYTYLDGGEFKVPGEVAGSGRYTLPQGFHFRIEPKAIGKDKVVVDLLVSYSQVTGKSDVGFIAALNQIDGRYEIEFDDSHEVTLRLPQIQTEYTLTVKLNRSE